MSVLERTRSETGVPLDRSVSHGVVELWALLGAAWTVFAVAGTVNWIGNGHAVPVSIQGPDVYATWRLVGMRVLEASSIMFVLGAIFSWIVRPWMRERRFTLEGMLIVGGCVGFFIDPLINNFNYMFAWNQHAVNLGTWSSAFPAWAPQGAYGEGLLWAFPQYIMAGAGFGAGGYWILTKLRAHNPRVGVLTASAVVFLTFFLADFVVENTFLFLQVYAYPRTYGALTLFAGSLNQFPVYSSILVGLQAPPLMLLVASARESTDGFSFVEQGAARFSGLSQTLVRCFAVIGFMFLIFAAWFIPMSWLSITPDSIIDLPSYLRPEPI